MSAISNKFSKIFAIGVLLVTILLPVQSFAGQRWEHGNVFNQYRGQVRVVNTRDGRRVVYRRINGRWVMVRSERTHNWRWDRYHHRRG